MYRVDCRNLIVAMYDGKDGFVGVREKFGQRYLFTEYDWNTDRHLGEISFGTVIVTEYIGQLPDDVAIDRDAPEREPGSVSTCRRCGEPAQHIGEWDTGRWVCGSGRPECDGALTLGRPDNRKLFAALEEIQVRVAPGESREARVSLLPQGRSALRRMQRFLIRLSWIYRARINLMMRRSRGAV